MCYATLFTLEFSFHELLFWNWNIEFKHRISSNFSKTFCLICCCFCGCNFIGVWILDYWLHLVPVMVLRALVLKTLTQPVATRQMHSCCVNRYFVQVLGNSIRTEVDSIQRQSFRGQKLYCNDFFRELMCDSLSVCSFTLNIPMINENQGIT